METDRDVGVRAGRVGAAPPPSPAWWPAGLLVTPAARAAVAFHSVPATSAWRQRCDSCGDRLRYPWLSRAFLPMARCAGCRARVGAPPFTVELALVAAAVALVIAGRPVLETVALAVWSLFAVVLLFVDAAVHRLPDRLTYPAALLTAVLLGVAAVVGDRGGAWIRAMIAGVATAAVFAALTFALGRRGPGLGDAKLMLSAGAVLGWLGWSALLSGLVLAFFAQGLWAVALLVSRRVSRTSHLAMGPFVIGATVVMIALAR